MGLDMYLYAKVNAPRDSALAAVIEKHLTPELTENLDRRYEDGSGGSLYVSGWNYPGGQFSRTPDPLYIALTEALNFTAHESSPHLTLERDGEGGFVVSPTIFYWRKANAIHQWFVERVQGGEDECNPHEVHPEMLMELLEKCEAITADPSKAPDLLPTQSGFFFGGTEYDEYYFSDIKETAVGLRKVVGALPTGVSIHYQSSW